MAKVFIVKSFEAGWHPSRTYLYETVEGVFDDIAKAVRYVQEHIRDLNMMEEQNYIDEPSADEIEDAFKKGKTIHFTDSTENDFGLNLSEMMVC